MSFVTRQNSLISRMNFNIDFDIIFLLENYIEFESKIKEITWPQNEISVLLNTIIVRYDIFDEVEEKKYLINNLKNYFEFIKIIYDNKNDINFMILNNEYYSEEDILNKINDKAVFGKEIKEFLKINDFPLNNYILEKVNNNEDDIDEYYDKIYILKKKNINNFSINNSFNLLSNDIIENNINNNINNNIHNSINNINNSINNINNNINFISNNMNNNNINNENKINDDNSKKIKELEIKVKELEKKLKEMEKIMEQKTKDNFELKENLNNKNNIINSLIYKNVEKFYIKNKLNKNINQIPININKEFLEIPFERHVCIYCPAKNKYLEMKNNQEVIESSIKSPWDITILFSKNTIIFYSKGYYLIENNGYIKGGTYKQIWNFEIVDNDNFYFICKKDNNILSLNGSINIINNNPGPFEKFKLIEISKDNNNHSYSGSDLSEKIDIKQSNIFSLSSND